MIKYWCMCGQSAEKNPDKLSIVLITANVTISKSVSSSNTGVREAEDCSWYKRLDFYSNLGLMMDRTRLEPGLFWSGSVWLGLLRYCSDLQSFSSRLLKYVWYVRLILPTNVVSQVLSGPGPSVDSTVQPVSFWLSSMFVLVPEQLELSGSRAPVATEQWCSVKSGWWKWWKQTLCEVGSVMVGFSRGWIINMGQPGKGPGALDLKGPHSPKFTPHHLAPHKTG